MDTEKNLLFYKEKSYQLGYHGRILYNQKTTAQQTTEQTQRTIDLMKLVINGLCDPNVPFIREDAILEIYEGWKDCEQNNKYPQEKTAKINVPIVDCCCPSSIRRSKCLME